MSEVLFKELSIIGEVVFYWDGEQSNYYKP
ncbi:hypothetical protein GGGNBK_12875 [Sporosarcina sp. ANT_H38]